MARAQSTIMAAATTVGTVSSPDVSLDSGQSAIVSIFVASGSIPRDCVFDIFMDTPGADGYKGRLTGEGEKEVRLSGPGQWRFIRRAAGADGISVGLMLEAG